MRLVETTRVSLQHWYSLIFLDAVLKEWGKKVAATIRSTVKKKYDENDIRPHILFKVKGRFGGTYRLNLLGRRINQA
jgi:mRNA-degrading endonuclease RelE of RelBE toxin-antitoxin system